MIKRSYIVKNDSNQFDGIFSIPIAEYTIGAMLLMAQSIVQKPISKKYWGDNKELIQCNLLIIGIRNIGEEIAYRAKPLFKNIVGVNRNELKRVYIAIVWQM